MDEEYYNRSRFWFIVRVIAVLVISIFVFNSESWLFLIGGLLFLTFVLWAIWKKHKRRMSLYREGDSYIWNEHNGSVTRSKIRPDEPGGAWQIEIEFHD